MNIIVIVSVSIAVICFGLAYRETLHSTKYRRAFGINPHNSYANEVARKTILEKRQEMELLGERIKNQAEEISSCFEPPMLEFSLAAPSSLLRKEEELASLLDRLNMIQQQHAKMVLLAVNRKD